ncbi:MAG: major capsid protein [Lachnospiraceae bacterium]
MAITTIADMQIVPSKFSEYVLHRTTEKSRLVNSGIAVADDRISRLINGTPKGGNMITMPYFNPLTGEDEVFGEEELLADGITTGNEVATLLVRQKAWGDTDLSRVYGGADPMSAIGNLLADWWIQREQAVILSILKGILAPTGALKNHILDVSGASGTDCIISVDNTLDAKNLMGDAYDKLGLVFMHSATYTQLQKQQKITTEYSSDLKINIDYYLGYQVIVDDGMPVSSGTYTTYFIGKGAFAREDGMPEGLVGTEVERKASTAQNILYNRRALVMHPIGVGFKADATLSNNKKYASNADLEKATNWRLCADHKNVPIVALKHRIEANPASENETNPATEE